MKLEPEAVEEVVIVGAGIAGLATAVGLKRIGIEALVLERAEGLRTTGAALTLFPNAWLALDALGVGHKLASLYKPLDKGYITDVDSGVTQEVALSGTNIGGGSGPRAVHRRALLEALAKDLPPATIRFSSKITSIEEAPQPAGTSIAIVRLEDGTEIKTKVLIGCDGVNSVVGRWLGLSAPVDSGRSGIRGLAVYPEGHGLKHEVRQFVDAGKRAGFVPLNDTELYWFFVCKSSSSSEGEMLSDPELIQRAVLESYAKNFPPIFLDVIHHTNLSTLSWAPLMLRFPWDVLFTSSSKGTITVAGDAMHPMTPDLGQGGCSALEDAVVLGRHIGESLRNNMLVPTEVEKAIQNFIKERRWRVAGLITASYLSGWAQQDGSGWLMKFFRDVIFYRFIFKKLVNLANYDCGRLAT